MAAAETILGREPGNHASGVSAHALLPILVGFSAPVLVVFLLDPTLLGEALPAIVFLMMAVFMVAAAIFLVSVFSSPQPVALVLDRDRRVARYVLETTFTQRFDEIAFDEIASLKVTGRYDRDGYPAVRGELVLMNGDRLPLPPVTTESEIDAAHAAIRGR